MATAKAKKTDGKAEAAAEKLAAMVANPKIDLTPKKKTASTSTFNGTLNAFGLMTIPVQTFKATDEDGVSFNKIHKCTGKDGKAAEHFVQLKQNPMRCPECEANVQNGEVLSGFNTGNDKAPSFLAVTKDEIEAQKPASDKQMTVTEFIDLNEIDPIYYESTEFIAAGKGGEKPLALLSKALRASNKAGKGTRVKGGRVQEFVLRPYGTTQLVVSYLRTETEVRNFDKYVDVDVTAAELELATTLIERFEAKFTPAKEDKYLANVRRMLEAKSAGVEVAVPEKAAEPTVTVDLMAALQASLAAAPKSKKASAGSK